MYPGIQQIGYFCFFNEGKIIEKTTGYIIDYYSDVG